MNPIRFFAMQLFVTLCWLLTFGALAFVIVHEESMLTVLQGWGMDDPFQIELGKMSMRKALILEAKAEAERFLERVKELDREDPLNIPPRGKEALWHPETNWGARVNGAVKRASLDLSRALAKMRRP